MNKKKEVKKFNIVRANPIVDNSKIRDEKIGNVLDENVQREYRFAINPNLVSAHPIVLVMPNSEIDDYCRTLLESVVALNDSVSNIVEEDAPINNMNDKLKDSICDMSKVMNVIIHSDSWRYNNVSEEDKKKFNDLIEKLKID